MEGMDDELVSQFISICETTPERAHQYLRLTDGSIEQAIELFYANGGADLGEIHASTPPSQTSRAPPQPQVQAQPTATTRRYQDSSGVVHIDTDEDELGDDVEFTGYGTKSGTSAVASQNQIPTRAAPPAILDAYVDDDEAMARRLQEELYTEGQAAGALGTDGVRAPIARTRETLVGPGTYLEDDDDEDDVRAQVMAQLRQREQNRQARTSGRPGIFNQRPVSNSVWVDEDERAALARSTAGASEASRKNNQLAEMYRPPFELMTRATWDEARTQGKDQKKWILVNVQDPSIFDCQVLNRDIWKNPGIMDTVRENFVFMQYTKDDPRGEQYINYYFQARDSQDAYPHIAIVDPRTGEQVKVWSGPPAPKPMEFLMQLHEFLDRYSLDVTAKNPIARRKPEPKREKEVDKMTEDEMLEMALQNSLAGASGPKDDDPDDLTRSVGDIGKGKGRAEEDPMEITDSGDEAAQINGHKSENFSPFDALSSTSPHTEPINGPDTTRIQFRHSNGRVVRRFALAEPVRRIYEWLKAAPLEGRTGTEFELIFMQKNLLDSLNDTIEQTGLKNGTVMVEFIESD